MEKKQNFFRWRSACPKEGPCGEDGSCPVSEEHKWRVGPEETALSAPEEKTVPEAPEASPAASGASACSADGTDRETPQSQSRCSRQSHVQVQTAKDLSHPESRYRCSRIAAPSRIPHKTDGFCSEISRTLCPCTIRPVPEEPVSVISAGRRERSSSNRFRTLWIHSAVGEGISRTIYAGQSIRSSITPHPLFSDWSE